MSDIATVRLSLFFKSFELSALYLMMAQTMEMAAENIRRVKDAVQTCSLPSRHTASQSLSFADMSQKPVK